MMKRIVFAIGIVLWVSGCAHNEDRDLETHISEDLIEEDAILSSLDEHAGKKNDTEPEPEKGSPSDLDKKEEKEDSLLSALQSESEDVDNESVLEVETTPEEGEKESEVDPKEIREDSLLSEVEEDQPPE